MVDLKNFRPISLVGNLYKLLARVLANRLKKVMNKLVNKAQNACIEGKRILGAFLIANEVMDYIVKRKKKDESSANSRISRSIMIILIGILF